MCIPEELKIKPSRASSSTIRKRTAKSRRMWIRCSISSPPSRAATILSVRNFAAWGTVTCKASSLSNRNAGGQRQIHVQQEQPLKRAGLATLDVLEREERGRRALRHGEAFREKLRYELGASTW